MTVLFEVGITRTIEHYEYILGCKFEKVSTNHVVLRELLTNPVHVQVCCFIGKYRLFDRYSMVAMNKLTDAFISSKLKLMVYDSVSL